MNKSPLSLDHYHLTELAVEPEIGYKSEEGFYPDFTDANLTSRVGIGSPIDDDSAHFALRLNLEIEPKSEGGFPYTLDVGIEGFFSVVNEGVLTDTKTSVLVNGSSMLYGALRELLLVITSRFENGALMLPTVNFLDLIKESQQKPDSSEKD